MADSLYPKKGEIIHASDVGETFVGVVTTPDSSSDWAYKTSLVRRNDNVVDALTYADGLLASDTPGSAFMTTRLARVQLSGFANEHHTHTSSDFTKLSDWRIRTDASNTNDLVFGDRYHDKWYLVPDSKFMNNSNINSICYGNGKFVAVSFGGKMAYSSDGATWTLISDPKFGGNSIYGIGYGNGKFVAVGVHGKMAYSAVGTGWTAVTDSGFNTDTYTVIYGVCYGNGKFVAVGGDVRLVKERISYSSDGINWTTVPDLNLDSGIPYSVCYGNGKFVAGGHLGKIAYSEVFH